jgi:cation-transporting ATPase 13A1
MTIASLSIAMFFLFLSRAEPLKELSRERPHKRLFTVYMLLSVLGQFALHMLVLLTVISSALPHTPTSAEHRAPEKTFKPNVLNSVVFLVSNTQTVATFAANYRGKPFMQGLTQNSGLFKALLASFALMIVLSTEMVPELNTYLELHALPGGDFKAQLTGLLLFDVVASYLYAHGLQKYFAIKPKASKKRTSTTAAALAPAS